MKNNQLYDMPSTGMSEFEGNNDMLPTKSNQMESLAQIIKCCLGIGIMGMPYAFYKTGYILGSLIIVITIISVYFSTCLIVEIVKEMNVIDPNYQDIIQFSLGEHFIPLYNFFIIILSGGTCVSYLIFFMKFFEMAFNESNNNSYRIIYLLLSLVIIIPASFAENFHHFTLYSQLGNILSIFVLIAVFDIDIELVGKDFDKNINNYANFEGIPQFIGISLFAVEVVGCIQPIYNSMQKPEKFCRVFKIACAILTILQISFCTCCCITLGKQMNNKDQIILFGLQHYRHYFIIFQLLYAIVLCFSYPLQLFPGILALESMNCIKINFPNKTNWKYIPRLLYTFTIFIVALYIPKFATFLNLLGAVSGTALQFFFPIIAYKSVFKNISFEKNLIMNNIMLLSLIGGIIATFSSIQELVRT